jgi:glycosyltransferase involved in cell wall biosynthesis
LKVGDSIPEMARYYHTARTAHIERLALQTPTIFYYTQVRADFDHALAAQHPLVKRKTSFGVAVDVVRRRVRILEVPEALAIALWPQLLLIHSVIVISNALRISNTKVVAYAIENYPSDRKLAEFAHIPRFVARLVVRIIGGFLLRTTDKVVFGTSDASAAYSSQLPSSMGRKSLVREVVWALPASQPIPDQPRGQSLVFLGTFEERKGITALMEAWPLVRMQLPEASLTLMGKAGLVDQVIRFAQLNDGVHLIEDPPRSVIFRQLGLAKALVLFSQPSKGWKEQVGLPIVEGLSLGCEIVSSDETGIAAWLGGHGHQVLPAEADARCLAEGLVIALTSQRDAAEIAAGLPSEDGRTAADRILFTM